MKTTFSLKLIKVLAFIMFVGALNTNCKAQANSFAYKSVPNAYLPSANDLASYRDAANTAQSGAYDLTTSLPQGFVKDGSVDYTRYLQQGINNNKKVIFPDFPVFVNVAGLSLISNSTVMFRPNSKIILMPNGAGSYQILQLNNLQNVIIYFPVIEGDKIKHTGNNGEWGMGISIARSSNIQIINPKISNCWGDGIYIGNSNENIKLYYPMLNNNRRNGISIISVNGLLVKSAIISNTSGTLPMSGIDIEPNNDSNELQNIDIENPVTFNNANHGIVMDLERLGVKNKNINIVVNNHIDDGSKNGFGMAMSKVQRANKLQSIWTGQIVISNATWKNNNNKGFVDYKGDHNGLNITMKNLSIYNKNNNGVEALDRQQVENLKSTMKNHYQAVIK